MLGATHFLRVGSSGTGKNYTNFLKMKCLQHHGGYMTCTSDRQTIAYTLRCPPPFFKYLKHFLVDATKNLHSQWEISDRRPIVRDDITRVTPVQRVLDLIQKVSFAGPLSNPVYCEEHQVDMISEKALKKFTDSYFGPSECTVASVGLPFEETILLADEIEQRTVSHLINILYFFFVVY